MTNPVPLALNHLAALTQDYGRMLNRSTGLCSLWTGACLGGLTALSFRWTWQHYLALGRPKGHYLRYLMTTQETLPNWILTIAFLLPFLWAPVMRGLASWIYPERFGAVRAQTPEWLKGLEALEGPMARWFPLGLLGAMACYSSFIRPLFWGGGQSTIASFQWRPFLAPLLGLLWAWLMPRLRKAEVSEGQVLVFVAGFLLAGPDLSILFFCFPIYILLTLAVIAYGLWAHGRYQRALAELEAIAPETADV